MPVAAPAGIKALALLLPQMADPGPANQTLGPYTYASHPPMQGNGGASALLRRQAGLVDEVVGEAGEKAVLAFCRREEVGELGGGQPRPLALVEDDGQDGRQPLTLAGCWCAGAGFLKQYRRLSNGR